MSILANDCPINSNQLGSGVALNLPYAESVDCGGIIWHMYDNNPLYVFEAFPWSWAMYASLPTQPRWCVFTTDPYNIFNTTANVQNKRCVHITELKKLS